MNPVSKRILFASAILIIGGLLIWIRVDFGSTPDPEQDAEPAGDRSSVKVDGFVVKPESFRETVRTIGEIRSDEEVYIRPESSGRITGIHFDEDSEVKEGDLLVSLNDAELQQEKRQVAYQINLARIREQRQKELLERNAIAQEDYDVVLNELNTLKARRGALQARIDKMEIRAPFDGIIGLRDISSGSYVSPENVITSLQKIDPLKIEFSIPERYRTMVNRGLSIRFLVEGSDHNAEGEIYAIHPRVDRETRTLRMRATAPNPDLQLFPGAYARVEVDLSVIDDALLIPSEALVPELTGYHVFVFSDGKAAERKVEIGTRTDRMVHIREGLLPRDTVITTGLLQIRDGMSVDLSEITDARDQDIGEEVTEL